MKYSRYKLTVVAPLLIGLILTLVFGIVAIISAWSGNAIIHRSLADNGRETLSVSARLLFNPLFTLDATTMNTMVTQLVGQENIVYVAIRDESGTVVVEVSDGFVQPGRISRDLASQAFTQQNVVQYQDGEDLLLYSPIKAGSQAIGTLEAAFDQTPQRAALLATQRPVAVATIALFSITIMIVFWLAHYAMKPLKALTAAVEEIGRGELDTSVPLLGMQETVSLGTAVDRMRIELQQLYQTLEQRVAKRTRALETSTEVSRSLSTILDEKELVSEVVEQVRSAFDYYYAHIYTFDEAKKSLIMAGGTGKAGQTMLARGHVIPKGKGLVGRAAETNSIVLVPDVSQEEGWLPNPLLPETKAEVAVPIAIGDEVMGVLDVQHNVVGGLGQTEADLIQSIANQVAIALRNARSYEVAQRHATREMLVNTINQKIQSATTIEDVLQTAVRELGQALDPQRASIQLSRTARAENGQN